MSFILDALKKSEAERQRQAGPALLEMRIVRPARRLPVWAIVAGTVLCCCVLALAWLAFRRPAAVAPAPAAAGVAAPNGSAAAGLATNSTAAIAPAAPTASAPTGGAVVGGAADVGTTPAMPEQSAGGAAIVPGTVSVAPGPLTAQGGSGTGAGDDNPADTAPAESPAAGAGHERTDTRGLRNYAELGGNLPELRLDLHVYATKPGERYAFINMHKVREGEVTAEGVTVKEITPDGVVLEYHGTEFLLGRQ